MFATRAAISSRSIVIADCRSQPGGTDRDRSGRDKASERGIPSTSAPRSRRQSRECGPRGGARREGSRARWPTQADSGLRRRPEYFHRQARPLERAARQGASVKRVARAHGDVYVAQLIGFVAWARAEEPDGFDSLVARE